jgi:hypothetical protein
MPEKRARQLLLILPIKALALGLVTGVLASFLIGFIPGVTPEQQLITIPLWTLGIGLLGLIWGIRGYMWFRKLQRFKTLSK